MSLSQDKVVAIIEARMGSTRLPGKHLLKANGKPMLQHLIERLQQVSVIDEIVIATTNNKKDDLLVSFASEVSVGVYRGNENDVMGRVVEAGEAFSADVICEITGDCPIIDPEIVEQVIQTFLVNNAVYVNNGKHGGLPGGMNVQVFYLETLKHSAELTQDPKDREHVTLHIKRNSELFPPIYLVAEAKLRWPELELTLDEGDDYELLKRIVEFFGDENPFFSCYDIIQLLQKKTDWIQINQHVNRKGEG